MMKAKLWGLCAFLAAGVSSVSEAATPDLHGNLNGNVRWTVEDSPYTLIGDLTITAGSSLTIEAGVIVEVAQGDRMGSGIVSNRTELIVNGSLETQGTKENPVIFRSAQATPATLDWYGIRVLDGGNLHLRWTNFSHGNHCIDASPGSTGSVSIVGGRAERCLVGVRLTNGTPVIDGMTVVNSTSYGFHVDSADAALNNVISANNQTGIYVYRTMTRAQTVRISHATVANNTSFGVYGWQNYSGTTSSINIVNSIIVNNGSYGIRNYSTNSTYDDVTFNISYSNVWSNTNGNYYGSSLYYGADSISTNPLFVNAANGNYHLLENSPCIDAGTSASLATDADGNPRDVDGNGLNGSQPDMGAYEFQRPGSDTTSPAIAHTAITAPQPPNQAVDVTAIITDNVGVSAATLYYRATGTANFTGVAMGRLGATNTYSATIPASAVTTTGVDYYFEANDVANNTSRNPSGTNVYQFNVQAFCEASTTCSNHGSCNANGSCSCDTGFSGPN
ncbi:MAG: hypothetical protein FWC28_02605, partial [Proteobacteria bacterium]|nr:hypothetical protein [Pseudomonadota bacterium]